MDYAMSKMFLLLMDKKSIGIVYQEESLWLTTFDKIAGSWINRSESQQLFLVTIALE
jgi:hypothetical protein